MLSAPMQTRSPLAPVIKWSGSKRSMARTLGALFPPAPRYLEPFVGGGAMLAMRRSIPAVAADIIPELMGLWELIRDDPSLVVAQYRHRWERLQSEGHTAFYAVRADFNRSRNPHDLMFLSRTCVNGLIRFSRAGDFNNSLHHTRPGIDPFRLGGVVDEWSRVLQGVELLTADYRETLARVTKDDFVFLDPPYAGTKGRYHPEGFPPEPLWRELDRLNSVGARWMLTFDGRAGKREYATSVPEEIYVTRLSIGSGHSPFTRLMGSSLDEVTESVYLNYEPSCEWDSKFTN